MEDAYLRSLRRCPICSKVVEEGTETLREHVQKCRWDNRVKSGRVRYEQAE